jgi:hypothetical protein
VATSPPGLNHIRARVPGRRRPRATHYRPPRRSAAFPLGGRHRAAPLRGGAEAGGRSVDRWPTPRGGASQQARLLMLPRDLGRLAKPIAKYRSGRTASVMADRPFAIAMRENEQRGAPTSAPLRCLAAQPGVHCSRRVSTEGADPRTARIDSACGSDPTPPGVLRGCVRAADSTGQTRDERTRSGPIRSPGSAIHPGARLTIASRELRLPARYLGALLDLPPSDSRLLTRVRERS